MSALRRRNPIDDVILKDIASLVDEALHRLCLTTSLSNERFPWGLYNLHGYSCTAKDFDFVKEETHQGATYSVFDIPAVKMNGCCKNGTNDPEWLAFDGLINPSKLRDAGYKIETIAGPSYRKVVRRIDDTAVHTRGMNEFKKEDFTTTVSRHVTSLGRHFSASLMITQYDPLLDAGHQSRQSPKEITFLAWFRLVPVEGHDGSVEEINLKLHAKLPDAKSFQVVAR